MVMTQLLGNRQVQAFKVGKENVKVNPLSQCKLIFDLWVQNHNL